MLESQVAPAPPAPRARSVRAIHVPGPVLLAALFAGAALISGFTMLRGLDPFDEGLVLQAARRINAGQAPYGDFIWAYGPAWPYALAGLFKLFGTSVVQWRVLRFLADAGVALLAFAFVRRYAGTRWALVAWLASACAMAEPRSANPFPLALLGALAAIYVASRGGIVWAGVLTALAAAFRLDFALYALAAVAVLIALQRRRVRPVAVYLAVAVGLGVLVYLPFLIAFGPAAVYDALVATSLRERDWWTLPFPWTYHGALFSGKGVKHLIDFYVPALLLVGLALCALGAALRRLPPLWVSLCVFGVGCMSYLLSRTDEFHTEPLLVTLAVLIPLVWARVPRVLGVAAVAVLALLLVHGMSKIHVAVADGAEAPPREASVLERVVTLVDARVPPGQPIYVAPARSDLVRYSNPLLYVLTQRPNATDRDFGLLTGAAAQRRLVDQLQAAHPRAIVRWTDPLSSSREPNLRGHPSGVHTLDAWIAAHYRPLAVLYHYTVLVPRSG